MIIKRKNKGKRENAVSAVIGVILMVAITVAVAVTVYVYVSGMFGGIKTHTASVACLIDSSTNRIIITTASANLEWNDIVVITDNSSVNWRVYNPNNNPLDVAKSTSGATADIAPGDYIEFDFIAHPGMSGNVQVSLRFNPSNTLLESWIITV
jgi:flagellin-like protein